MALSRLTILAALIYIGAIVMCICSAMALSSDPAQWPKDGSAVEGLLDAIIHTQSGNPEQLCQQLPTTNTLGDLAFAARRRCLLWASQQSDVRLWWDKRGLAAELKWWLIAYAEAGAKDCKGPARSPLGVEESCE
jgi:hypothetical protein